jgi:hypothetical protein
MRLVARSGRFDTIPKPVVDGFCGLLFPVGFILFLYTPRHGVAPAPVAQHSVHLFNLISLSFARLRVDYVTHG